RWDGRAVSLDSGQQLLIDAPLEQPPGAEVHAAFRPSPVQVLGSAPMPPRATRLRRAVSALQPLGDLVRVRAGDLGADVTPQQVSALHLQPGTEIDLVRDRVAFATYPSSVCSAPAPPAPRGGRPGCGPAHRPWRTRCSRTA